AAGVVVVFLEGNAVVDSQWPDWQVQTQANSYIGGDMAKAQIVRIVLHKASIIKNCTARFCHERKSIFDGGTRQRLASQRLTVNIFGSYVTKFETAEVIRSAKKQAIVNMNLTAVAPSIDCRQLPIKKQNRIPRQKKIFRTLQIEAINLFRAAEKTPGDVSRERHSFAMSSQEWVVAS